LAARGASVFLDPADYQRTVDVLLAGGFAPRDHRDARGRLDG
jgi:hypothetical protein